MFIFCMILRCVVHVTISFVCWKGHIVSNDTQNLFYAYIYMCLFLFAKKKKTTKKQQNKIKNRFFTLLISFNMLPTSARISSSLKQ